MVDRDPADGSLVGFKFTRDTDIETATMVRCGVDIMMATIR